jgi:3'-phosphoadenosine 5'-phosphosulfate sulfotransferase (PAPS reductase)/FAD synthetase
MDQSTTPRPISHAKEALPIHLKRLEAESIEIMREVAAEFRNPVMLYSIGKGSSVMLHLGARRSTRARCISRCCMSIRPGSSAR